MTGHTKPRIHVVAGVLRDTAGRVLICERPAGKHMAGHWEFPGGKRHDGESSRAALRRELDEELGVRPGKVRPLIRYTHIYPDRIIDLDVWRVEDYSGAPHGREGQTLEWLAVDDLSNCGLLPADLPIVTALRLGSLYAVTGVYRDHDDFRARLTRALDRGASLVQIRNHTIDAAALTELVAQAVPICQRQGARLVVNGDPAVTSAIAIATGADGLHLPARHLGASLPVSIPAGFLLGASCHNEEELRRAASLGVSYAVLGPVGQTASHPGARGIGWQRFARCVEPVALPVYGIGGLSPAALPNAWDHGAQGIAAITSFWS